jgi:hypothetical protein
MPKVSSGLAGNSVVGDRLDLAGADPATPVLDCYTEVAMNTSSARVSHDLAEETPEAKARWFASLTLEERMDLFCEFTDLALDAHPSLVNHRHVQSTSGRVRVLEQP